MCTVGSRLSIHPVLAVRFPIRLHPPLARSSHSFPLACLFAYSMSGPHCTRNALYPNTVFLLSIHPPHLAQISRTFTCMCPRAVPRTLASPHFSGFPLHTFALSLLLAISCALLLLTALLLHSNGGREKKLAEQGTTSAIKDVVKAVAEKVAK